MKLFTNTDLLVKFTINTAKKKRHKYYNETRSVKAVNLVT